MTEMTGVTYVGGILGFKVVSGEENGRFAWFSLRWYSYQKTITEYKDKFTVISPFFFLVLLEIKPRTLTMLGKPSIPELYPSPLILFFTNACYGPDMIFEHNFWQQHVPMLKTCNVWKQTILFLNVYSPCLCTICECMCAYVLWCVCGQKTTVRHRVSFSSYIGSRIKPRLSSFIGNHFTQ